MPLGVKAIRSLFVLARKKVDATYCSSARLSGQEESLADQEKAPSTMMKEEQAQESRLPDVDVIDVENVFAESEEFSVETGIYSTEWSWRQIF